MPDLLERLKNALSDRYAIESEIGRGGMATVFLAEDLKHGRKVAIKVLHPEIAATLGTDRFLREIQIAAHLEHPGILPLHDSGEAEGLPYYVMPYVEGESLRERLEREKQLPIEEAVRIAREVADGLGYAHRHGVVHRDIKPANIMLAEGHSLIADFGVARAVGADGKGLTSTGLAVGTPAYMSPEQASGAEGVDARSDLYALGCVVYEMLAGEPPLTGATPQATAALRLTETATSLGVVRETVPGGLDAVVSRTLAKSPADRYATAEALGEALGSPEIWEDATPARRFGRRAANVAISLGLLAAGVFLARMFTDGGPGVDLSESRIAVLPLVPAVGGDTALQNLGHAVAAQISANLGGIGDIETVSYQTIRANEAVAGGSLEDAAHWARNETGAARVAHGSLVRTGDEVSFEVNLLSSEDLGAAAQASFTTGQGDPRLLADSISWQILGQLWSEGEAPVVYYDHLVGRPFPAVTDFLLAERLFGVGWEVEKAARAYERAFKADTTLWAASMMYELLLNQYGPGAPMPERDTTVSQAHWRHIEDLPTPYREFAVARQVYFEGRYEEHLALYEELLAEHPAFWPAAMDYGDSLIFWAYLYGYSADDVIQAHVDCVDANPHALECWFKLLLLSAGKDEAVFQRAFEHFDANLEQISSARPLWYSPDVHQTFRLFMAYEEGDSSEALLDSVAAGPDWFGMRTYSSRALLNGVNPRLFCELYRRRLEQGPGVEVPPDHLYLSGLTWAMRGAWDSTLVAIERYTRESEDDRAPLVAFKLTAIGEWMGAIPTGASELYAARAVTVADDIEEPAERAIEQAVLLYTRGVLAASGHDAATVRHAERELGAIDHPVAGTAHRALRAYQLQLSGNVAEAADSLYEVTWRLPGRLPWRKQRMISINRLNASRWSLEAGDTTRAAALLSSCQSSSRFIPEQRESDLLAGHCYLELARIEEAWGRDGLARKYYWQFVKRYDMPVEALRPMVEEAREGYVRVGGDPSRLPPLPAGKG